MRLWIKVEGEIIVNIQIGVGELEKKGWIEYKKM